MGTIREFVLWFTQVVVPDDGAQLRAATRILCARSPRREPRTTVPPVADGGRAARRDRRRAGLAVRRLDEQRVREVGRIRGCDHARLAGAGICADGVGGGG